MGGRRRRNSTKERVLEKMEGYQTQEQDASPGSLAKRHSPVRSQRVHPMPMLGNGPSQRQT